MNRGTRETAEVADEEISEQPQVRRATSIDIDAALRIELEARLDAARPMLEAAFGCRLGDREGTGLLRYEPGGFYRRHADRGEVPGWPMAARRAIAVVVFLNADFEGGALRLYQDGDTYVDVTPVEGQLIAFRADASHEAMAVTAGIRDVAVDWFYDPETH